jgi:hypothetical protein
MGKQGEDTPYRDNRTIKNVQYIITLKDYVFLLVFSLFSIVLNCPVHYGTIDSFSQCF